MNTLNLNISDPSMLVDKATPIELLSAIRNLKEWGKTELNVVNRLISVWSARAIANPNDREGISELQRLIHYTLHRANTAKSLPEEYRYRWEEANDMLEARRLNLVHADPDAQFARRHVREILVYLHITGNHERPQSDLADRLGVTTGRVTQLIGNLEANGLITKRKHGRDNLLKLTETGLQYAKKIDQKRDTENHRAASFLKIAS
ncbi:MAG: MarR family transcriptional regulator [Chlorobiaceae bacterium]|nr:MarR family transcriptional regulator [Chlorobiaceae bacterium]